MNKGNLIMAITVTAVLLAAVGEGFVYCFAPGYNSAARFIIPFYFWALYTLYVLVAGLPAGSSSFARRFMAFKSAKMVLSLFAALGLSFAFKECAAEVVVNFFAYYILLLVPESAVAIYIKKRLKC